MSEKCCEPRCENDRERPFVRCAVHNAIRNSQPKCDARVWDNGDTTNCGEVAVRESRCVQHMKQEIETIQQDIATKKHEIEQAEKRIATLLGKESLGFIRLPEPDESRSEAKREQDG
jgi:hypothetical protein